MRSCRECYALSSWWPRNFSISDMMIAMRCWLACFHDGIERTLAAEVEGKTRLLGTWYKKQRRNILFGLLQRSDRDKANWLSYMPFQHQLRSSSSTIYLSLLGLQTNRMEISRLVSAEYPELSYPSWRPFACHTPINFVLMILRVKPRAACRGPFCNSKPEAKRTTLTIDRESSGRGFQTREG